MQLRYSKSLAIHCLALFVLILHLLHIYIFLARLCTHGEGKWQHNFSVAYEMCLFIEWEYVLYF